MRRAGLLLVFLFLTAVLPACGRTEEISAVQAGSAQAKEKDEELLPLEEDLKSITLPEAGKCYRLLVVNDLHIIEEKTSADITEDAAKEIQERRGLFVNAQGTAAKDQWEPLVEWINAYSPDAVLFLGDMTDFYSPENLKTLKEGMDKIEAPYLYIRADHDYGTWYVKEDGQTVKKQEAEICDNSDVVSLEFPDFVIVGINNSTSPITEDGVRQLEEIWKKEKPVLLATHVPLNSLTDQGLYEASKESWGGRALLWGAGCTYEPDENTQDYLDMVFADNSPVFAVAGAHLHFPYTVPLNGQITEFVFDATYKGKIGVITISGEDSSEDAGQNPPENTHNFPEQ